MTQIPNFTDDAFKDDELFKITLTKVLSDLNKTVTTPMAYPLQSNGIYLWVDDGVTPIPSGYEIANGMNKTFDASKANILQLQKVSG